MANSRSSPCGVVMTVPAALPYAVEEMSTCNNHFWFGDASFMVISAISETKSANACALMVVLGKYEMSYSLNSTAYFTSRPEVSLF
ncbi:UNVERIFIED_CONTAM: hypothetical protein Sradi_2994600 [Sesamum radiatum]|uniref:Uncharacterized protein n=1 Tax=Sesamum radiatum TaxID=300843 RepID=A0AAW2S0X0_SESRA